MDERINHNSLISEQTALEARQIIENFIHTPHISANASRLCSQSLFIWHEWKRQQRRS